MQLIEKSSLSSISNISAAQKNGISREEFLQKFFSSGSRKAVRDTASEHLSNSGIIYNKIKDTNLADKYSNPQMGLLSEMLSEKIRGAYTLSVGGWDDHVDVNRKFSSRINALFSDIKKLVDDLKTAGEFNRTTILIYSEFGRRIGENGSSGSDHGRGGLAYVLGGRVNGGSIYKTNSFVSDTRSKFNTAEANPKLNLDVDIDIRQVYAQIFKKQFRLTNAQIKEVFNNDSSLKLNQKVNFFT